jgi:hypothetical protein
MRKARRNRATQHEKIAENSRPSVEQACTGRRFQAESALTTVPRYGAKKLPWGGLELSTSVTI